MNWQLELTGLATVALAGLLGGVIGIEREFADKPAGLRTHFLVAAASALLIVLGGGAVTTFARENPEGVIAADPVRVIQAVVVGISFLGGGTIVRAGTDSVGGLTTAASIFLTAGVGMAVAVGYIMLAVGTALMALFVLVALRYVDALVERLRTRKD